MNITLPDLRTSKVFVKEGSNVRFGSASDYIDPFLEHIPMGKASYIVEGANRVVNAEVDGNENIAYPRVHLQAQFHNGVPDELGMKSVMGIVYALDIQKPVIKVYTGMNVSVCMNLTIFHYSEMFQQEILSANYREVYDKAKTYAGDKEKQILEYQTKVKKLKETNLDEESLNELIGRLLLNGSKSRLGTTPVVQAAKSLLDNSSPYYVWRNNEFACNLWNVYNSVTDVLTNKVDFTDRSNKIIALSKIMLN